MSIELQLPVQLVTDRCNIVVADASTIGAISTNDSIFKISVNVLKTSNGHRSDIGIEIF